MNRNEAVTYLKEIIAACSTMAPDSLTLFNSKPDSSSVGYQIHIQAYLDEETECQVKAIAEKHGLGLKKKEGKVIIYKPNLKEKG